MWKNIEHSLRVEQLPSVELHVDVAAQACIHPLMTIPQMVTCDKQTVPLAEDGHVPMEPREEAQWGQYSATDSRFCRLVW